MKLSILGIFLLASQNVFSTSSCDLNLSHARVSQEQRHQLALDRSTPEMMELLVEGQNLEVDGESWILVELVQDQSALEKTPPIPNLALTYLARIFFNRKIRDQFTEPRPKNELPRLIKMHFQDKLQEFNGMKVSRTAHSVIKLKLKDLPGLVDNFVSEMNHPALGNKVFKIALVTQ